MEGEIKENAAAMEKELKEKIKGIILGLFKLDENGNPTIPTDEDVGQLEPMEFSAECVDRIWRLVK